ncbi:Lysyl-tRNA synthetase (class I) [hydrothermal vent metagenome]|uniref:Lysine--tRNA ligase n=1 Tax=hydrothermal vent metagenome TaxID=652676 RepID=A0A3B0SQQ8_9ZZZZ
MTSSPVDSALRDEANNSKAWPFLEAQKLIKRIERGVKQGGKTPKEIIFETGYGPSGLPHIGTFGEVSRTSMVRHAFETLSDIPTRLLCFSDDMDGLRKVPDNVENKKVLADNIGKALTNIPDPYGTHDSFGAHNNARLQSFLDDFGFDYEFISSTDCYKSGRFDAALVRVLEKYDEVMAIMLATLREERSQTYSPFLPIHPETQIVMQVPLDEVNVEAGTIVWRDPDTGKSYETPVTGGACKLQWKPDWAMRWHALGVDYEMAGKDLIDSVKVGNKICRALGSQPPEGFNYELFLDDQGRKISKSIGNGLTINEWLRYASPESLQLFMYQKPMTAKRLYFDIIPKNVDEYFSHLSGFEQQDLKQQLSNPVWHIHSGNIPQGDMPVSFALLLNLVSASNAQDSEVLWGFIERYAPGTSPETHPDLDRMVGYAINYFVDFVKPTKSFRLADEQEKKALEDLSQRLADLPADSDGEAVQSVVYAVGKDHGFEPLRTWFGALYEVLLGQKQGPRFGSFAALYGLEETRALIAKGLAGELVTD